MRSIIALEALFISWNLGKSPLFLSKIAFLPLEISAETRFLIHVLTERRKTANHLCFSQYAETRFLIHVLTERRTDAKKPGFYQYAETRFLKHVLTHHPIYQSANAVTRGTGIVDAVFFICPNWSSNI